MKNSLFFDQTLFNIHIIFSTGQPIWIAIVFIPSEGLINEWGCYELCRKCKECYKKEERMSNDLQQYFINDQYFDHKYDQYDQKRNHGFTKLMRESTLQRLEKDNKVEEEIEGNK